MCTFGNKKDLFKNDLLLLFEKEKSVATNVEEV